MENDKSYYQKLICQSKYLHDILERNSQQKDISNEEKIKFPFIVIEYLNNEVSIMGSLNLKIRSPKLQLMRKKQNSTAAFQSR